VNEQRDHVAAVETPYGSRIQTIRRDGRGHARPVSRLFSAMRELERASGRL
jgi:hypothetical protein